MDLDKIKQIIRQFSSERNWALMNYFNDISTIKDNYKASQINLSDV